MAFQLYVVTIFACLIHVCYGDTETQSTAVLPPKISDTDTAASILGPLGLLGPAGALGLLGPASPLLSTLVLTSLLGGGLGGLGHHGHHGPYHNHHASLIPLLLASTYGRYLPYGLGAYGLYGYSASNTVQNSKPFGNYKYEERP